LIPDIIKGIEEGRNNHTKLACLSLVGALNEGTRKEFKSLFEQLKAPLQSLLKVEMPPSKFVDTFVRNLVVLIKSWNAVKKPNEVSIQAWIAL
jgi:hypothetical protein